jgi:hypothetical protein
MELRHKAKEAIQISALLMTLGVIGLIIEGGLYKWLTLNGILGLACSFALIYIFVLAWVFWFYRKR